MFTKDFIHKQIQKICPDYLPYIVLLTRIRCSLCWYAQPGNDCNITILKCSYLHHDIFMNLCWLGPFNRRIKTGNLSNSETRNVSPNSDSTLISPPSKCKCLFSRCVLLSYLSGERKHTFK